MTVILRLITAKFGRVRFQEGNCHLAHIISDNLPKPYLESIFFTVEIKVH